MPITKVSGAAEIPRTVNMVVCLRVADVPHPNIVSEKERCGKCEAEVWVSAGTPIGPPRYCVKCLEAMLQEKPDAGLQLVMPPADDLPAAVTEQLAPLIKRAEQS